MGLRHSLLAAVILVAALLPAGSTLGADEPPAAPLAGDDDVHSWTVGDTWSHHIYSLNTDGVNVIEAYSWIDTTVAALETVIQYGQTYDVYNVTATGTLVTEGVLDAGGIPVDFNLSAGVVQGYAWIERGDGGVVRNNETVAAQGIANIPIVGIVAMQIDAALTTLNDPPVETYDFPLLLGDEWVINSTSRTLGYNHIFVDVPPIFGGPIDQTTPVDETVVGETMNWANTSGPVAVPAGTFDATHIRTVPEGGGLTTDVWYAPTAKNMVRTEVHGLQALGQTHTFVNLTAYSLVTQLFGVQIALEPNPVNPGGSFFVNGTTAPDAQVQVSLPFTADTYAGAADPSGAFSFLATAPSTDDHTPANADHGSHGVIVDAQSGPLSAYNVSTVILQTPDLWALDGEIGFNPPPTEGVPTDVSAVVHAAPRIGIYNAVDVEFSVDGVPFAVQTLPSVPADAALSVSATWDSPTAGPHWVNVTLDPADAVPETNETNNTATAYVFIGGPDLTPANLSARGGQFQYPDAAAAAYLSDPIGVTLGEVVDLAVEIRNAGILYPGGLYELAAYNTTGLGGPPADPPFFTALVDDLPPPGATEGPFTTSWTAPASPGDHYVNITADWGGTIDETDEGNNTFTFHFVVDGPDYVPADVTASPVFITTGATADLTASARNQGVRDAFAASTLAFYNASTPASPFFQAVVPPLAVGESSALFSVPWSAPPAAGIHNATIAVDYLDDVAEMAEGNNSATIEIRVMAPPLTTITFDGPQDAGPPIAITDATQVQLTATDRSGFGLAGTFYRVDGGTPTDYGATGPFTLADEGLHTIAYYSTDNLGGVEPTKSVEVLVDAAPPVTTLEIGEPKRRDGPTDPWRVEATTPLALAATDSGGVGVDRVEYRLDGGSWTTYEAAFTLESHSLGAHTLEFRAVDDLGNVEAAQLQDFLLEEPGTPGGTPGAGANLKPVLAVALALLLMIVATARAGARRGRPRDRALLVGGLFAFLEGATGVVSLAVPELAVPPLLGAGMLLDIAVFLIGLAAILVVSRPPQVPLEEEE